MTRSCLEFPGHDFFFVVNLLVIVSHDTFSAVMTTPCFVFNAFRSPLNTLEKGIGAQADPYGISFLPRQPKEREARHSGASGEPCSVATTLRCGRTLAFVGRPRARMATCLMLRPPQQSVRDAAR